MATSHIEVQPRAWNGGEGRQRQRRSPLDWLSRMGIGLLSFFSNSADEAAGASSTKPKDAYADQPVEQPIPDCCSLARPDKECHYVGSKTNYTCPDGFYRQFWVCLEGTQLVGCGECTQSTTTCWDGDFDCSIWFWVEGSC